MRGSTHMILGGLTGTLMMTFIPGMPSGGVLLALVGSIVPDIDHAGSFISRRVKLPIHLLLGHRGFTHSLLAIALMGLVFHALHVNELHSMAFLTGYTSHLAADAITRSGIRFFYPLEARLWLLPRGFCIPTGGVVEFLISAVLTLVWGYIVLRGIS